MIDLLSGEFLAPDDVLKVRQWPLPQDNWYPAEALDQMSYWGTTPENLFALVDDGSGPRWLPVEMVEAPYPTKRKPGRPKGSGKGYGDSSRRVTVRLNEKEAAILDRMSADIGMSSAEVIRALLRGCG